MKALLNLSPIVQRACVQSENVALDSHRCEIEGENGLGMSRFAHTHSRTMYRNPQNAIASVGNGPVNPHRGIASVGNGPVNLHRGIASLGNGPVSLHRR